MNMHMAKMSGTTRGKLLALLRVEPRTVNALAESLGLTDNAVRAQLEDLQGAGLVVKQGVRKGIRKPHVVYSLTARAQQMFSRLYVPALNALLAILGERMAEEQVGGLVREVGQRLAEPHGGMVKGKPLAARIEYAVKLLRELGGEVEAQHVGKRWVIEGKACPLGATVTGCPQICGLAEALLGAVIGVPVREQCVKGEAPRCCFEVEA